MTSQPSQQTRGANRAIAPLQNQTFRKLGKLKEELVKSTANTPQSVKIDPALAFRASQGTALNQVQAPDGTRSSATARPIRCLLR